MVTRMQSIRSQFLDRRTLVGLVIILIAGCSAAPGGSLPDAQGPGEAATIGFGAEVYGYSCARCHNPRPAVEKSDEQWRSALAHMRARANLTGGEVRALMAFLVAVNPPDPKVTVYDTTVIHDSVTVFDTIVRIDSVFIIRVGGEEPVTTVRPDTVQPVVVEQPEPVRPPVRIEPPPTPEPVVPLVNPAELGQALATAKGCVGCHIMNETGGNIGPELDALFGRREESYVRRKLLSPRFDNPNSVMPDYGLQEEQIDHLIAYLRSLQRRQ